MGMYLSTTMIYGIAWDHANTPALCFPENGHGEQIEPGEPVGPDGALVWGYYGHTTYQPDRYLDVVAAHTTRITEYAQRADMVTRGRMEDWDQMIWVYLSSLGFTDSEIDRFAAPGWLALASWG